MYLSEHPLKHTHKTQAGQRNLMRQLLGTRLARAGTPRHQERTMAAMELRLLPPTVGVTLRPRQQTMASSLFQVVCEDVAVEDHAVKESFVDEEDAVDVGTPAAAVTESSEAEADSAVIVVRAALTSAVVAVAAVALAVVLRPRNPRKMRGPRWYLTLKPCRPIDEAQTDLAIANNNMTCHGVQASA